MELHSVSSMLFSSPEKTLPGMNEETVRVDVANLPPLHRAVWIADVESVKRLLLTSNVNERNQQLWFAFI